MVGGIGHLKHLSKNRTGWMSVHSRITHTETCISSNVFELGHVMSNLPHRCVCMEVTLSPASAETT